MQEAFWCRAEIGRVGGSLIEEVRTKEIGNAGLLIVMLSPGFLAHEEGLFVLDAMRRRAVPQR